MNPFQMILATCCLPLVAAQDSSGSEVALPYHVKTNVVYAEVHGVGLLMDLFTPVHGNNGHAIVEVTSGVWHSDRDKLDDLKKARVFEILCGHGYTVFAIRPGSITKFGALEMVDHVERGILWVKENSQDYEIDPDKLGLMGASAGGHLACLVAVTNGGRMEKNDSSVAAVGVFFPPTDFLDYGGVRLDPHSAGRLGELIRALAFPAGVDGLDDEQVKQGITAISPARRVTKVAPPFLLIHGGLDLLVPLQQSRTMVAALKNKGVPAQLIIKNGGGHPWPTVHEEVTVLADWFDRQLDANKRRTLPRGS